MFHNREIYKRLSDCGRTVQFPDAVRCLFTYFYLNSWSRNFLNAYKISTRTIKLYEFLFSFMKMWRANSVFAFPSWSVSVCWSIQEHEEGGCSWPQNWKLLTSHELRVVSERNLVPTKHRFPQLHFTLFKSLVTNPQFVAQFYLSKFLKCSDIIKGRVHFCVPYIARESLIRSAKRPQEIKVNVGPGYQVHYKL